MDTVTGFVGSLLLGYSCRDGADGRGKGQEPPQTSPGVPSADSDPGEGLRWEREPPAGLGFELVCRTQSGGWKRKIQAAAASGSDGRSVPGAHGALTWGEAGLLESHCIRHTFHVSVFCHFNLQAPGTEPNRSTMAPDLVGCQRPQQDQPAVHTGLVHVFPDYRVYRRAHAACPGVSGPLAAQGMFSEAAAVLTGTPRGGMQTGPRHEVKEQPRCGAERR